LSSHIFWPVPDSTWHYTAPTEDGVDGTERHCLIAKPLSDERQSWIANEMASANKKKGKSRRKRRGHWCWACDRFRANERFTGRGHARHLCRDWARLGADELAYRRATRDLGQCIGELGFIVRKRRRTAERFLGHPDLRLRA
jgi:hypothetical protein